MGKLEAVKLAQQQLGTCTSEEIAAFVSENFGVKIKPAIVTVLLASLREREQLDQSRRNALEAIEKAKAEQGQTQEAKGTKKSKRRQQPDTTADRASA
jgi:hypothetical protein